MDMAAFFEELAEQILKILVSDESCGPSENCTFYFFTLNPVGPAPALQCYKKVLTSSAGNAQLKEVNEIDRSSEKKYVISSLHYQHAESTFQAKNVVSVISPFSVQQKVILDHFPLVPQFIQKLSIYRSIVFCTFASNTCPHFKLGVGPLSNLYFFYFFTFDPRDPAPAF